jgi:hypothetical protein
MKRCLFLAAILAVVLIATSLFACESCTHGVLIPGQYSCYSDTSGNMLSCWGGGDTFCKGEQGDCNEYDSGVAGVGGAGSSSDPACNTTDGSCPLKCMSCGFGGMKN